MIEAIQWNGGAEFVKISHMVGEQLTRDGYRRVLTNNIEDDTLVIATLEGDMTANLGDWIIKGVKSECYPCKPDIFEQTYEPV